MIRQIVNGCLSRGRSETLPYRTVLVLFIAMIYLVSPASAQDAVSTPPVTDDQVNAIAQQMYCPVCENIPLDVCGTEACAQWRDEIRAQLTAGRTEDQIISDFVARYGDRVVGTPQDPTLRALSLVTPWLIGGVIVLIAGLLLIRWWRGRSAVLTSSIPVADQSATMSDDEYRARLERDLVRRR